MVYFIYDKCREIYHTLNIGFCWNTSHLSFWNINYIWSQSKKKKIKYLSICCSSPHKEYPKIPPQKKKCCIHLNAKKIPPAAKPKLRRIKLHTSQAQQWEAKALAQQLWSLSWPGRSRDPKADFLHKNAAGRWTCNGLNRSHTCDVSIITNIKICMI